MTRAVAHLAVLLLSLQASPVRAQLELPHIELPNVDLPHIDLSGLHLAERASSLRTNLQETWTKVSESVEQSVQNPIQRLVGGLFDFLRNFVMPLSNILYVGIMLYGFAKLPANFMLVAGLFTMFIGPLMVGWTMRLIVAGLSTAAYAPFIIVFSVWLVVFLKSALFQRIALALGLDRDGDGDFDWLDLLKWCSETRCGEFLQLSAVYAVAANFNEKPGDTSGEQQPIIDRLERIEAALHALPTSSEAFASKQRAKLAKQGKEGSDLVRVDLV